MRRTRHRYHYAMRAAKNRDFDLRKQRLAEACSENNTKDMWRELKQMNPKRKVTICSRDEASTNKGIADAFAKKYESLFKSVPTSTSDMATVTSKVDDNLDRAHPNHVKVFSHDVAKAVNKLNRGKRDGHGDFYSDHLINASPKLFTVLAMLINCMIMHGYSPSKLLESTTVPIPKDNRASLTCSENYRAIALCNSICKLVDIILIEQYSDALYTSDLQFGLKKNHSTLICTTVLLDTVSYFTKRNYDVYACFFGRQ